MGVPSLDASTVALGLFILGNVGTLIWHASAMKTQLAGMRETFKEQVGSMRSIMQQELAGMQKEIDRHGRILETLADVKAEMRANAEVRLAQGRRIDELTTLVMSHLIGERAGVAVNEAKGI